MRNGHRRNLFVTEDGRPARFFLHESIRRQSQRQKLKDDIEAYGGRVASTDNRVDTVLISSTYDKDILRLKYNVDDDERKRGTYVERLTFVQHCIRQRRFEHRLPIVKGMGGALGRKNAVPFTASDDYHLQTYIARTLPRKETGGRFGYHLYRQLVRLGVQFPEDFDWATRHSYHAWRARYKKMRDVFEPEIERIAEEEGTFDEPSWPEDRRMSRRRLRTRGLGEDEYSEGEFELEVLSEIGSEEEEEEEEEEVREDGEELQSDDEVWDNVEEIAIPQEANWELSDEDRVLTKAKKRKRQQSSPARRTAAKKRRSGRSISPSYPARFKGKEIAHESGQGSDDDIEIINTIGLDEQLLPEEDETDIPIDLRSPERNPAEPPSRSGYGQMSLTQDTLVNTQSRIDFDPVSHSTSANRRHSGNVSRNAVGQFVDPRPPSPRSKLPKQRVSSRRNEIHPETTEPGRSEPEPGSRQKVVEMLNDAPYKNTRARSRSVEPNVMAPKRRVVRGKRNSVATGQDVHEETTRISIPVAETIEEEMDVEQILMHDGTISVPGGTKYSGAGKARENSLETDDAQTRRDLHAVSNVSGRPLTGTTFRSNRLKANDVLRKFTESSRRYSLSHSQPPSTQRVLALDENRQLRRSPPRIPSAFGTSKVLEPHTPMNVSRGGARLESTPSENSFPLKGTRASAKKKEKREQEKRTPYNPPKGTRAARLVRPR